ncbi:MAG TPA: UbiA family prenyltransferase [Chloroflexota bacterium]
MIGSIRLIHPFPAATVVLTTAALVCLAFHRLLDAGTLVRALGVIAGSQVAVGALNDYVDRADDTRTRSDKPLPQGVSSPGIALFLVVFGTLACESLALTFGPASALLAGVGLISGLAYDVGLKRTPLSAVPYVVSFLALLTWIWLIAGRLSWVILVTYPVGACLLMAAHLANALPDIEIDARLGQHGLAVVLGPRGTMRAIGFLYYSVAAVAAAACVIVHSFLGLALVLVGSSLAAIGWRTGRQSTSERNARVRVFRLLAPAIATLAAGCLAAFASVM